MYVMPIPVVYDICLMCNVFWVLYVPCVHNTDFTWAAEESQFGVMCW